MLSKISQITVALLAIVHSLSSHATTPVIPGGQEEISCEKYLASLYEEQNTFTFTDATVLSLKPEVGSIEERNPGTIRRLLEARAKIKHLKMVPFPFPSTLPTITHSIISDLQDISDSTPNAQLKKLIADYLSAHSYEFGKYLVHEPVAIVDFNKKVSLLYSSLWELTLANLFAGDEIVINSTTSKLHPNHLVVTPKGKVLTPNGGVIDREIDIAVRRGDRWRWIEVKDWNKDTVLEEHSQEKLLRQAQAQNQIRRMIGDSVEFILLLKYGLSDELSQKFKTSYPYDQILFAIPHGF